MSSTYVILVENRDTQEIITLRLKQSDYENILNLKKIQLGPLKKYRTDTYLPSVNGCTSSGLSNW